MNGVEILKQYALDNYESGGHWVFETYSDAEYAKVLVVSQSIEAAKKAIKEDWELCEERKQECGWM
jgi:hypothetical protein